MIANPGKAKREARKAFRHWKRRADLDFGKLRRSSREEIRRTESGHEPGLAPIGFTHEYYRLQRKRKAGFPKEWKGIQLRKNPALPDWAKLAIGFGLLLAIGQYIEHQQKPPPTCDGSISGSICTRVGL